MVEEEERRRFIRGMNNEGEDERPNENEENEGNF